MRLRGRNLQRLLLSGAILVAVPLWLAWVPASNTGAVTTSFAFTGRPESYAVPSGICLLHIRAVGAAGGEGGTAGTPGTGAEAIALVAVKPGERLVVRVGGRGGAADRLTPGAGGWNGGGDGGNAVEGTDGHPGQAGSGGGGATDVRRGGNGLGRRVLVAGGGAGSAGRGIGGPIGIAGGNGGARNGPDGFSALGSVNPATGGKGGTRADGGVAGTSAPYLSLAATAGSLGVGGNGASGGINGGGGGGGGLYGGGGGGSTNSPLGGGEGGGGSGYGPPDTTYRTGVWGSYGSGRATISYDPDTDSCDSRAAREDAGKRPSP